MKEINNHKNSLGVIVLGGIFYGAAFLPILYLIFKMYVFLSWQYFLMAILPQIIIYLILGLLVLNKWYRFSNWQKAGFIGIGIQYILLFSSGIVNELLIVNSLFNYSSLIYFVKDIFLSPLEYLYYKCIISQRVSHTEHMVEYKVHFLETGLFLPVLQLVYAGTIGGLIGKLLGNVANEDIGNTLF